MSLGLGISNGRELGPVLVGRWSEIAKLHDPRGSTGPLTDGRFKCANGGLWRKYFKPAEGSAVSGYVLKYVKPTQVSMCLIHAQIICLWWEKRVCYLKRKVKGWKFSNEAWSFCLPLRTGVFCLQNFLIRSSESRDKKLVHAGVPI